jgi:hypothetical protein
MHPSGEVRVQSRRYSVRILMECQLAATGVIFCPHGSCHALGHFVLYFGLGWSPTTSTMGTLVTPAETNDPFWPAIHRTNPLHHVKQQPPCTPQLCSTTTLFSQNPIRKAEAAIDPPSTNTTLPGADPLRPDPFTITSALPKYTPRSSLLGIGQHLVVITLRTAHGAVLPHAAVLRQGRCREGRRVPRRQQGTGRDRAVGPASR